MTVFSVPKHGLLLDDGSNPNGSKHVGPPAQIMRLDLAAGTIDELLKCARKGNPIHVAFGKTVVCAPVCSVSTTIFQ